MFSFCFSLVYFPFLLFVFSPFFLLFFFSLFSLCVSTFLFFFYVFLFFSLFPCFRVFHSFFNKGPKGKDLQGEGGRRGEGIGKGQRDSRHTKDLKRDGGTGQKGKDRGSLRATPKKPKGSQLKDVERSTENMEKACSRVGERDAANDREVAEADEKTEMAMEHSRAARFFHQLVMKNDMEGEKRTESHGKSAGRGFAQCTVVCSWKCGNSNRTFNDQDKINRLAERITKVKTVQGGKGGREGYGGKGGWCWDNAWGCAVFLEEDFLLLGHSRGEWYLRQTNQH